jgi:hypothetical protein
MTDTALLNVAEMLDDRLLQVADGAWTPATFIDYVTSLVTTIKAGPIAPVVDDEPVRVDGGGFEMHPNHVRTQAPPPPTRSEWDRRVIKMRVRALRPELTATQVNLVTTRVGNYDPRTARIFGLDESIEIAADLVVR